MPSTQRQSARPNKMEKRNHNILRVFAQYFVSPILVVAAAALFNFQLEEAKQRFQYVELELKRIEAARAMIEELFSGIPERAFVAERLMTKVLDEKLSAEIRSIVEQYYTAKFEELLASNDVEKVRQITSAAEAIGSDASKKILETFEQAEFHVVVASLVLEADAIRYAEELRIKGYPSEVYLSRSGYYAVTIGRFHFDKANRERTQAMAVGVAKEDSWLSQGKTWMQKIFPPGAQ